MVMPSLVLISFIGVLLAINIIAGEPQFRLNPKKVCSENPPDLLVWTHTAPTNHRKRNAIRMTWGNPGHYDISIYKAKVLFFIGLPPSNVKELNKTISPRRVQSRLEYEQEVYGDLVQGEFVDTYRNMTHKAVHSLRWISTYCSTAKFIMKVDDDILVNIFKLLPYLRLKKYRQYYPTNIISCNLWRNIEPIREIDNKWYISEKDYPRPYYPPFCQGMVYFVTPDLVPRLYEASLSVPYIFMDDVYVTGLLTENITNPRVAFRKLSGEYAGVYGIGTKVVGYVEEHKKSVTFVHTDHMDSYFASWDIIYKANLAWDIDSRIYDYERKQGNNNKRSKS